MAEAIRLQKYLSGAGVASRRTAEEMIRAGQVKVNGKVITELGTRIDPDVDAVEIDRVRIRRSAPVWLALHKPIGYVTTRSDPEGRRTIYDLLPPEYHGLFYVGRLDVNSEGLLLLTNQGEVANQLTHPSYEVDRVYKAEVKGIVTQATARRIMQGVQLEDGVARAHAVHIDGGAPDGYTRLKLTLREGKNREVRRLLKEVGHPVTRLMRVRYGPIKLEGLEPGAWRRLGVAERSELSSGTAGGEARRAKPKGRAQRVHREARAGQRTLRDTPGSRSTSLSAPRPGSRPATRPGTRPSRPDTRPATTRRGGEGARGRTEEPRRPAKPRSEEERPARGPRPDSRPSTRPATTRRGGEGARGRTEEPRRPAKPRNGEDRPARPSKPRSRDDGPPRAAKPRARDDRPERPSKPRARDDRPERADKPRSRSDRPERKSTREGRVREEKEPRKTSKQEPTGRGAKRKSGPPSGPQPRAPRNVRGAKAGGSKGPPPRKPRRGPGSRTPRG